MEVGQSLLPYNVQQISMGRLLPIHKLSAVRSAGDFFQKLISKKKYHLLLS